MDDADELAREANRRSMQENARHACPSMAASNVDFAREALRREDALRRIESSDMPPGGRDAAREPSHSAILLAAGIKYEYIYGMLGLVLGLAAILGGCTLCLHGVSGSTSWTASALGMKSQVNDAAPGVVLFIVGLFMIFVTKPKVRLSDLKG